MKFNTLIAALGCAAAVLGAPAYAVDFPTKPVKVVVPFGAGSATDKLARLVADRLSTMWKQPVIVENKGGASGFIASSYVAKSAPDGYTIMVTSNTTHASNSALFKEIPYDPVADFAPISKLGTIPLAMVVHPSVPANNVMELIAYARENPGKVFFGSGSTSARMAGEMFKSMAKLDITNAQYKSNPEAATDLAGGHIQMMIADIVTTLPLASAGKLRALGVSTAQRTELAGDLPTIAEAGNLPGFEMVGWFALYASGGTPSDIVAKINKDVAVIMSDPEIKKQLFTAGVEAEHSTPEKLSEFQANETAKWKQLVADAKLPLQ